MVPMSETCAVSLMTHWSAAAPSLAPSTVVERPVTASKIAHRHDSSGSKEGLEAR